MFNIPTKGHQSQPLIIQTCLVKSRSEFLSFHWTSRLMKQNICRLHSQTIVGSRGENNAKRDVCVCVCIYVYVCVCMCIHIYIHIHIYNIIYIILHRNFKEYIGVCKFQNTQTYAKDAQDPVRTPNICWWNA